MLALGRYRPSLAIAPDQWLPPVLTVLVWLSLLGTLRAEDDDLRIGHRVMPRWSNVELKVKDQVVATAAQLHWPMTVKLLDGKYVWLHTPQVEGWVHKDDLVELSRAEAIYTAQIRALLKPPRLEHVFQFRGDCYADAGDLEKAIADYSAGIARNARHVPLQLARAIAYDRQGQFEKAIADCNEAIRLEPKCAEAFYLRGRACWHAGQFDAAIANCDQAIQLQPKLADAWMVRGVCWQLKRNLVQALADFDRAIALAPRVDYLVQRAKLHQSTSHFTAALADVVKALSLQPGNPQLIAMRNDLALALRRSARAQMPAANRAPFGPPGYPPPDQQPRLR